MTLAAGTVSVVGGVASGSRLALALFNAKKAAYDAAVASFTGGGGTAPSAAEKQAVFSLFALEAQAMATAIVGEITGNAAVTVPLTANQIAAGAPAAPMNLGGTVA